jgi:hypothetical protein
MKVVILVVARVQGAEDARDCGFMGLFGETPILGFFNNGSIPSTTPKIWLTCAPDSTTSFGS